MRRLAPFVALAALLAACGSGGGGRATLWVTTDMGRHVLVVKQVPSGLTAAQALERETKVTTRYGGRFIESIDGIAGSLSRRHDWFYFVNGMEADRSAAEYRLHAGDIEWWDYRDWGKVGEHVPVVVGAFPEPFLHGYDGARRPAVVVGSGPGARAIARLLHARVAAAAPAAANVFRLTGSGRFRLSAHLRPSGAVEFDFSGDALQLARDPGLVRFRFSVP